jgi:hypothetical protein
VYRFTITGSYRYSEGWSRNGYADAAYSTDADLNFKTPYWGIEVDGFSGRSGGLDSWTEDRALHRYSFLIEGTGARIPLRVQRPEKRYCSGELKVLIELLPKGTPSVALRQAERARAKADAEWALQQEEEQRRRADEQALALRKTQEQQERAALQQELRRAELARQERDLDRQVDELKRMVHINRNIFDPEFRRAFVHKHQRAIRQRLSASWCADYNAVFSNEALAARLRKQAPEVLQWYEERLTMSMEAERAEVMPSWHPGTVPLTPRASESAKELIAELYRTQDTRDAMERSTGVWPTEHQLASMDAAITTGLSQLSRYGVVADSPEAAEQQLIHLIANRAVKTPYEEVRDKLAAGQSVGLDIVAERVKDLFREQCILVTHRRQAIRKQQWQKQREFDERLANSRAEFAQWVDLLREQGFQLNLGQRDQEETLEEGIIRLCREKQRVKDVLTQLGDTEGAEAAEALYAEQIAGIFKPAEVYN